MKNVGILFCCKVRLAYFGFILVLFLTACPNPLVRSGGDNNKETPSGNSSVSIDSLSHIIGKKLLEVVFSGPLQNIDASKVEVYETDILYTRTLTSTHRGSYARIAVRIKSGDNTRVQIVLPGTMKQNNEYQVKFLAGAITDKSGRSNSAKLITKIIVVKDANIYLVESQKYIPGSGRTNQTVQEKSMVFNRAGTEIRVQVSRPIASMDAKFGDLRIFSSSFFGKSESLLSNLEFSGLDPDDSEKKTLLFRLKKPLTSYHMYSGSPNHNYLQVSLKLNRDRGADSKHESPLRDSDGYKIPYDRQSPSGLDDADTLGGYFDIEPPEPYFMTFQDKKGGGMYIYLDFKEDVFFSSDFSQTMFSVHKGGDISGGKNVIVSQYNGPTNVGGSLSGGVGIGHKTRMVYSQNKRTSFVIDIESGSFVSDERYTVKINKDAIEDQVGNRPSKDLVFSPQYPSS